MATIGTVGEFVPESENVESYLERVEVFLIANNIEDACKASVLISLLGSKVYGVLRNILAPDLPQGKSLDELITALKGHYAPKPLIIGERFNFHKRNQSPSESIAEYVSELQKLASTCDFGPYLSDALRDRFVCGLVHNGTQRKLLAEADLTFKKAVIISQGIEQAEKSVQEIKKRTRLLSKS